MVVKTGVVGQEAMGTPFPAGMQTLSLVGSPSGSPQQTPLDWGRGTCPEIGVPAAPRMKWYRRPEPWALGCLLGFLLFQGE